MSYAKESSRWYSKSGDTIESVPSKAGTPRKPTIRDARKEGWLPSVTTILSCAAKPALDHWKQKNAIIAALTTPRIEGEGEDAFAERVLSVDAQSVSDAAKEHGKRVHAAIEQALKGEQYDDALAPWVMPVLDACTKYGKIRYNEKSIVGEGYAGKTDAVFELDGNLTVVDFKTCSTIPKAQYDEHLMQLGAYANALKARQTANIYILTAEPKIAVFENSFDEWDKAFHKGFIPLLNYWQYINNYNSQNA